VIRKLIAQGVNGYTCYLPKQWIDSLELTKGSEIDISIQGNSLVITPLALKRKVMKKIVLVDETETSIRTLLTAAYRKGVDKLHIEFQTKKQYSYIQDTVGERLLGMDFVDKGDNYCILENITEPAYDQFDAILYKIFFNLSELIVCTISHVKGESLPANPLQVANRIQQYDNFCRRVIAKNVLLRENNEFLWAFLTKLVHVSRELYHICELDCTKLKASETVLPLENLLVVEKMLLILKTAYIKKDVALLSPIHGFEKEVIYIKGYAALTKSASPLLYHSLVCVRQTYLSVSSLSGILV
jgi:antitoxin component of MazEF toxin-antitoxin module